MTDTIDFIASARALSANQQASDWLSNARQQGSTELENAAWPTRKTEAWKYTSLYALTQDNYLQSAAQKSLTESDIADYQIEGLDAYKLVFVNGQFNADLSDNLTGIEEFTAAIFSNASDSSEIAERLNSTYRIEKHLFAQINNTLLTDGLYLVFPKNKKVSKPIHLLQLNTHEESTHYSQQRVVIVSEQGSQATIIDHRNSLGESNSVYNNLTEIHVASNANLAHITLQLEAETQVAISGTHVKQERDSHYQNYLVAVGSKIKRNDLQVNLTESNARATLHGVYMCKHQQHIDNQTAIDHIAAHCDSEEAYRGLIADKGKATFNGRIHIHKDAQKTEAHLNNKNLLLSKQAEINTKPELEIYADDVKCSHGATIGQLDEKSLFYFQSRGIDQKTAEAMLCFGFVNAMVTELPVEAVQDFVAAKLAVFFNDIENLQSLWGL